MKKFGYIVALSVLAFATEIFVIVAIYNHDADYKQERISRQNPSLNVSETIDKGITKLEKNFIESGGKLNFSGRIFIKRNELFDPKYLDDRGQRNIQRMKDGLAPIGKDGKSVALHHMKQKEDGVLVEVSGSEHTENTKILHGYTKESEVDHGTDFNSLRANYWKYRAKDFN